MSCSGMPQATSIKNPTREIILCPKHRYASCSMASALGVSLCRGLLVPAENRQTSRMLVAVPQVEVFVHCAANTGFHVPLDEIVKTNVRGFMELLKISRGCRNLKVARRPLTVVTP